MVAARAGRHKDIVQLIDEGADVNYRDPYNGRTCLINAAFGKTLKYTYGLLVKNHEFEPPGVNSFHFVDLR